MKPTRRQKIAAHEANIARILAELPSGSEWKKRKAAPVPTVSRLQEALEACDAIDRAHDKPDERPVATCRFRLLSRDVRVNIKGNPVWGKNRAQRTRITEGFRASQCRAFARTLLPVSML